MRTKLLTIDSIFLVVAIMLPRQIVRAVAADLAEAANRSANQSAANRSVANRSSAVPSRNRRQRVRKLLEQLDADLRTVRVQAVRELLRLGPKILPDLPPPELLPNAAVRQAVRRIRLKLERQQAVASVRFSRVTLRKQTQPLAALFHAIEAETHNRIDLSALPAETARQPVTVDYNRQPFWKVIDDLARRGNLRVAGDGSAVQLSPRGRTPKSTEVAVTYSGPFRIAVHSATWKPLFGDAAHHKLRLRLSLLVEPRLRPLFLNFTAGNISPTADGTSIEPLVRDAKYERSLGEGGKSVPLLFDFKVPISARPSQIDLTGRMTMTTAAGSETIRFTQAASAHNVARRRGGVTVTLRAMTFGKKMAGARSAEVQVAVGYDTGGPAFESHRTWMFHNQVYLLTKTGRRLDRSPGLTTSLQTDGVVAVGYRFDHLTSDPSDYDFVYVAPTLIIDVPIDFTLKKVPVSRP